MALSIFFLFESGCAGCKDVQDAMVGNALDIRICSYQFERLEKNVASLASSAVKNNFTATDVTDAMKWEALDGYWERLEKLFFKKKKKSG